LPVVGSLHDLASAAPAIIVSANANMTSLVMGSLPGDALPSPESVTDARRHPDDPHGQPRQQAKTPRGFLSSRGLLSAG
jgi:hypothetical protein